MEDGYIYKEKQYENSYIKKGYSKNRDIESAARLNHSSSMPVTVTDNPNS